MSFAAIESWISQEECLKRKGRGPTKAKLGGMTELKKRKG